MPKENASPAEPLVHPETTTPTPETPPEVQPKAKKKSLYQRYVDAKRGRNVQIPDADLLKYTGKTKDELQTWAKDRPGVAGNQAAGKLAMGPAAGLGGMAAAEGYGGWGPSAEAKLKFPPKDDQEVKKGK
ncbi:uncharacterized protein B0H64DRAFT_472818 [Chaetomium fimeti]|uniref:Uncharacterized protein n=1 Tax=Chaetomium fimeti TaxID=1854472 RepID=A0AAE0HI09_9PEZI|nr:hypothetical protein B0H64DRAFT_472818 [Chaetomium fimeti]